MEEQKIDNIRYLVNYLLKEIEYGRHDWDEVGRCLNEIKANIPRRQPRVGEAWAITTRGGKVRTDGIFMEEDGEKFWLWSGGKTPENEVKPISRLGVVDD